MGTNVLSDQLLLVCHICSQLSLALQAPSCSRLLLNCSKKHQYQKEKIGRLPYATVFPNVQQLWFTYLQTYFRKIAQGLLFLPFQSEFIIFLIFPDQKTLTVQLINVHYRNLNWVLFIFLFLTAKKFLHFFIN